MEENEIEEDVREHNEDMEKRYDRAFAQVTQEGEVETLDSEMEENRIKRED